MGGGRPIPDPDPTQPQRDFERLETAVLALADRHRQVVRENEILRREVDDRDRRIDALEAQALELNQRRRDVGKRIDDLLAQIDQLDAGLGAARD